MAEPYRLNYGWARVGPVRWAVSRLVTLQVDLESRERGPQVWETLTRWWEGMDGGPDEEGLLGGGPVAYSGGARFPRPVRTGTGHVTAWVVSSGQDAFDTIAFCAQDIREVAEAADPAVEIVWTELPHRRVEPR